MIGADGADGFGGVLGDCADVLGSVCSAAGGRRAAPSTVSSNCTYKVHKTMKEHSSANLPTFMQVPGAITDTHINRG